MAAGIERYPLGPIERYPSDLLVSVEADDAIVRGDSLDSLYREFSLDDPLQRDLSLDSLYRNDSINPDVSLLEFASGFPDGGKYVLTKDARAFADPNVGDIAIETVIASEMIPEDDAPVVQLDDGDFAKDAVAPVTITEEVHIESGDLSDTQFAGTIGVNDADPMLDMLVSDTISGVPTPEHSHEVIQHLERAGIVPKVLDRFTPTTTVRVIYENLEIQNGMKVMASDMSKPPMVKIEGAFVMPGSLYTVMFVAYNEESYGPHLHWLHVNYQGPQSIASAVAKAGADVVHYVAPKAAANLAFLLFRQTERLVVPVAHAQDEVSVRGFAAEHHLTQVGALCFEAV